MAPSIFAESHASTPAALSARARTTVHRERSVLARNVTLSAMRFRDVVAAAKAELQRVLAYSRDVTSTHAAFRRAQVLAEVGRYSDAERHLRDALTQAADEAAMLAYLAYLLRMQRRYLEALTACQAALTTDPSSAGAHIEHAEILMKMWRGGPAVEAATEAVRLDPHDADTHRILARALAFEDHYDQALDCARRSIELAPGSVESLLTLAGVQRQAGNVTAAAATVREALRIDPTNSHARWLLAMCDADRTRVAQSMRTLTDLALEQPFDHDPIHLLWPLRHASSRLRWWLPAGAVAVTGAVLAATRMVPAALANPTTTLARLLAGVTAFTVIAFLARVLLPAGRTPWRCLPLVSRLLRGTLLAALLTQATMVALLAAYAIIGWSPLPVLATALTPALWTCLTAQRIATNADNPGLHQALRDVDAGLRELGQDLRQWARDTRRDLRQAWQEPAANGSDHESR